MPIAEVELPDGRIAEFDVPKGTTPDQVVKFAQQNLSRFTSDEISVDPDFSRSPSLQRIGAQEQIISRQQRKNALDFINSRDPGIDYFSGIQDTQIRANFSRMDTEAERVKFLRKTFGKGNFRKDGFGAWVIEPAGLKKAGFQHNNVPIAFDEQGSSLADVADLRGDAPVIAGSILAAMLTGGQSAWLQAMAAGGGAAFGGTVDELIDAAAGENIETAGQVATRVGTDAAIAGSMDLVGGKIARTALAPQGKRFTPDTKRLVEEAREIGVKPPIKTQIQTPGGQPTIMARVQAMADRIFGGNPLDEVNQKALLIEAERLGKKNVLDDFLGKQIKRSAIKEPGEVISNMIQKANSQFREKAAQQYAKVDAITQGQPVIATAKLKQTINEILTEVPKRSDTGAPVATTPEMARFLDDFANLDEFVTVSQMQAIRQRLADAVYTGDLVPGLSSRQARLMMRSTVEALEDVAGLPAEQAAAASAQLAKANKFYRENIKLFDDQLIAKITREQGKSGAIDHDLVVQAIFKKKNPSRIHKVKRLVPDKQWELAQDRAMEDLVSLVVRRGEDPRVLLFDGNGLLKGLDSYGRETLEAMFGKAKANDLYRLGRVTQFISRNAEKHGGLVAANIALHPIKNLPKLIQLRVMSKFMNSDMGVQWLTEGIKNPVIRENMIGITKASLLMAALAEDETGVANISLPDQSPNRNPNVAP